MKMKSMLLALGVVFAWGSLGGTAAASDRPSPTGVFLDSSLTAPSGVDQSICDKITNAQLYYVCVVALGEGTYQAYKIVACSKALAAAAATRKPRHIIKAGIVCSGVYGGEDTWFDDLVDNMNSACRQLLRPLPVRLENIVCDGIFVRERAARLSTHELRRQLRQSGLSG